MARFIYYPAKSRSHKREWSEEEEDEEEDDGEEEEE
jgi:hypothetical protein